MISHKKLFFYLDNFKEEKFKGGIDYITPSYISGWLFRLNSKAVHDIFLISGNDLLSVGRVNIIRNDVSELFNLNFSCGFHLLFPEELPPLNSINNPRVIAIDIKDSVFFTLKLFRSSRSTFNNLSSILGNKELYGYDGLVEGVNNGNIIGWVGKRYLTTNPIIWIQSKSNNPQKILCSHLIDSSSGPSYIKRYGFNFNLNTYSLNSRKQIIGLSFDKEGEFMIPSNYINFIL